MTELNQQDITVFLVEDDEIDRMAFERHVRQNKLPYKYVFASSVQEVKEKADEAFDVAVVDYNLGDGTGMDVLPIIGSKAPVIFVTGQGDQKLAVEAMKAGIYDYLIKDHGRAYLDLLPVTIDNAIIRKRSEQRIRKMERQVEKLLWVVSKTDNSMAIASADGIIEWVNEGFERLTGYKPDDVIGTHADLLYAGGISGLNPESSGYKELMSTKQSVTYEAKNYRSDGTWHWVFTTLTPIINDEGEIVNIVAIDSDITARKEAELQLMQSKLRAEKLAKTKEDFLANMSHEIRTPMNAIVGMVQLLNDTSVSEKQAKYLKSISFASENLLSIINDVLDFSKLEADAVVFEETDIEIVECVDHIGDLFRSKAEEKGLELKTSVAENVPSKVIGDPTKVCQIMTNLLGNAIKFTEEGQVSLSVAQNGATDKVVELELAISDTGIGIPEEKRASVFSSFEQAETNTTRKYGGTGLGLAITKKLAEGMGGSINLSSEVGKGSTFSVVIPFAIAKEEKEEKEEAKQSKENPEIISLEGKRVLLVEDNELNQMVANEFLTSAGIDVTIVDDGALAVESVEKEKFDLILMDIQMPNMDGYQAAGKMRSDGIETPIIAMTAHAFSGEKEKCLAAGMNDYLTKPIKRDLLHAKISELLNK